MYVGGKISNFIKYVDKKMYVAGCFFKINKSEASLFRTLE